ncbi:PREDICTED: short-chain dehydrogenase/reductase family 16C member 6-like [Gavialis gangeticus]|uniref:short-chain dehydrogenase/reductase family 16C member 6-like n=1 Tax=Gavialis gangeticus TaxID=94835 RepID=UPI00092E56A9|nr:PREDICTED: short-chain dehydrogenase/reductase family 16C member 6-like [Gavialis gangeticus]
MSCINTILETIQFLVLFIYYYFEAFILLFFPTHKNVAGEIVLITGAANGIGREIAIHFAPLGVKLVLWDIDEEGNKETIRLAKINGAKEMYAYRCDCSNRKEVYETADLVRQEVGDVTILVNDAAVPSVKYFIDTPNLDLERTMDVNIMAHFWTCKAFLPAMIARNHGHLISISSGAGLVGVTKVSDYSASKFAVVGFLESIAFELQATGKKGVKTTIVFLSYVKTQFTGRLKIK